jgi:hypothetical protein
MKNKLKSLSVSELQSIIQQALSSSLGEKLNVTISSIDYGEDIITGGTFTVEVWKDPEFPKYASSENKKIAG